ncbi:hypothetical protein [Dactylosporangium matsuzakiense]|uniref:Uncharacterized protein n=1 Tax=Dactylosporangium matsuzakiense TaxID=53360 RepID=A0A9W6NNP9_9ACTN|nr:hypothetical protein [Dactylosporangium matsuzakiense]UWZ46913.1 hypothetical protein Dmats_11145 [Dactylosporangium matsuzakiense]GLL04195.1 hypothetical protein GCM10017581_059420 [Dactylosporangium matsuzakiense]
MTIDFPHGWWGTDLGAARASIGTYELYSTESLPAVDESRSDGSFAWLVPGAPHDPLRAMEVAALAEHIELPVPFARFMSSQVLMDAIPSCTGCDFDLAPRPVPSPVEPAAQLVRFLRDQQDAVIWYLYLRPGTEPFVIASPWLLEIVGLEDVDRATLIANMVHVADSFEQFIHRFWLENSLWFGVNEGDATTDEMNLYLAHYTAAI